MKLILLFGQSLLERHFVCLSPPGGEIAEVTDEQDAGLRRGVLVPGTFRFLWMSAHEHPRVGSITVST